MKSLKRHQMLAVVAAACLAIPTFKLLAEDSTTATATVNAPAPLSYGATEVLQLSQAKVGDSTILAYIQHSGNNFNVDASQIIYLRQQGVSETVLTAMLNHPQTAAPSAPTATATTTYSTATVAPTVTYVQTAPAYYYSDYPYYYDYYGYPYYWYPPVSVSIGWWGGWGWGWHDRDDWRGFHTRDGFHDHDFHGGGGGFHSGGGSGFHTSGGGGFRH